MADETLQDLATHTIGGGWGQETEDETHSVRVGVIRGTDLPRLLGGDFSSVPYRFESPSKVRTRALRVGDIVIEVAGGSAASGQHTGRSILITDQILTRLGGTVIPASFCRLLRLDPAKVEPGFIVHQIASMHLSKEIAEYENQSTGIANFQFTRFIDTVKPLICEIREQKKIAHALDQINLQIVELRAINSTLVAIAQTIFKSWFVDFDPVHAKARGVGPSGLSEKVAKLFPSSFEMTALGEIPAGWQHVPFGQLLGYTIGGDWGSEDADMKNDTRVAIIRGTDIPDLKTGAGNRVPIRYTNKKKLGSRILQDGDLVIEVSGGSKDQPTGRSLFLTTGLLDTFDCPVEPASFCRLFRPKSEKIGLILGQHLEYIYSQGKTWEYQNQSTGIANFQTTHFLQVEHVVVPDGATLDAFNSVVRPIVEGIYANIAEARTLAELRDNLLPHLVSSRIRIPEAQELIEAIAA